MIDSERCVDKLTKFADSIHYQPEEIKKIKETLRRLDKESVLGIMKDPARKEGIMHNVRDLKKARSRDSHRILDDFLRSGLTWTGHMGDPDIDLGSSREYVNRVAEDFFCTCVMMDAME